jgi:thiamine biosynthesis protein ThiC
VKINANIGNSAVTSTIEEEVENPFGPAGSRYDYGLIYGENIHETRDGLSATLPYLLEPYPFIKLWRK